MGRFGALFCQKISNGFRNKNRTRLEQVNTIDGSEDHVWSYVRSLHGDPAVTEPGGIWFNTRVPIAPTEEHALERDTRSSVARRGGGNFSEPGSLVMGVCENKWVVSLRAFRLTDFSDAEVLHFKIGSYRPNGPKYPTRLHSRA